MVKNFVEMIMDQKATGREVLGTRVEISGRNKKYEVTAVDTGKITLTELLPEDSEEPAEVVVITEANAAVAHYLINPNEHPVVDAKYAAGKLEFADMSISTGTLPIKDVFMSLPGHIIVTTEADNGRVGLMDYDIQNDEFKDMYFTLMEDARYVALNEQQRGYIISNEISQLELKDDNGKPTGQIVDVAVDCQVMAVVANPVTGSYSIDDPKVFDSPVDQVFEVPEYGMAILTTKKTGGDGYLVDAPESMIRVYDYDLDDRAATFYVAKGEQVKIVAGGANCEVLVCASDSQLLVRNHRGLVVVDDKAVVDAMAGYDIFCRVDGRKNDRGQNVTTWTFCNDKLEVKSFEQVVTDRGILFSVV